MHFRSEYGLDQIIDRRFNPMYKNYIENIVGLPDKDEINFSNHSFVEYFKSVWTFFYVNEIVKEKSGHRNLSNIDSHTRK